MAASPYNTGMMMGGGFMFDPNDPYSQAIMQSLLESGDLGTQAEEIAATEERARQLGKPAGGGYKAPDQINRAARGILAGYNEREAREQRKALGESYTKTMRDAAQAGQNQRNAREMGGKAALEMKPGQLGLREDEFGNRFSEQYG